MLLTWKVFLSFSQNSWNFCAIACVADALNLLYRASANGELVHNIVFESRETRTYVDRRFRLASFLHSLWLVLSVDRPNREIELVMVWNATLESAWRTEVFLALFLRSSCSAWSILHFDWAIIFFEALSITFRGYEAGRFHAYWVITSSCGLCFGKCFLTGFDHRCSLPLNDFILLLFQYYLLDLRAFIAAK